MQQECAAASSPVLLLPEISFFRLSLVLEPGRCWIPCARAHTDPDPLCSAGSEPCVALTVRAGFVFLWRLSSLCRGCRPSCN